MRHAAPCLLFLVLGSATLNAETLLLEVTPIAPAVTLAERTGHSAGVFEVAARPGQAAQPVLTIGRPQVTRDLYALRGEVRYRDVVPAGYLELMNHFADGAAYFTRSLAESGPMARLSGTSEWRPFVLPFSVANPNGSSSGLRPEKLELSVALPGSGSVTLRAIELVEFTPGENPLAGSSGAAGAWYSERAAGLFGAVAGSVLGLCGALIGTLAGLGRARGLVVGLSRAMIVLGGIALATGLAAFALGQPWYVAYGPLLTGCIALAVFGGLQRVIRTRYEQIELRRIAAADFR